MTAFASHPDNASRGPGRLGIACALAFFVSSALAQDRYVVVDRSVYWNVFEATADGALRPITDGVPWKRASSVAIDSQGNYIVTVNETTAGSQGIYRVTPGGAAQAIVFGDPFQNPLSLVIDRDGSYLVLDDPLGNDEEGWPLPSRLIRATSDGQVAVLHEGDPLRFPTDIAIDAQGRYVISERGSAGRVYGIGTVLPENGAIYRFDPATAAFTVVRSSIDANGNAKMDDLLGHLASIAIDADGNYVVVEAPTHYVDRDGTRWEIPVDDGWILRLRPDGEILAQFRVPDLEDKIALPLGIAIDQSGNYVVADGVGVTTGSGRLLRVTPDGQFSIIVSSTLLGCPKDVAILPALTGPRHRADFQDPQGRLDLTEVNRVLAYWRGGGYHPDPQGADGFAVGRGDTHGARHTADYQEPYWQFDGAEVNRVLAYWRAGGYHADDRGADGFAPGL